VEHLVIQVVGGKSLPVRPQGHDDLGRLLEGLDAGRAFHVRVKLEVQLPTDSRCDCRPFGSANHAGADEVAVPPPTSVQRCSP
jgi:hypothetical protein